VVVDVVMVVGVVMVDGVVMVVVVGSCLGLHFSDIFDQSLLIFVSLLVFQICTQVSKPLKVLVFAIFSLPNRIWPLTLGTIALRI
jgi:hypothetical protein